MVTWPMNNKFLRSIGVWAKEILLKKQYKQSQHLLSLRQQPLQALHQRQLRVKAL